MHMWWWWRGGRAVLLALGMRGTWPGEGPAFSLSCPAVLVLEFGSKRMNLQLLYPEGAHLPPTSTPQPGHGASSIEEALTLSPGSLWNFRVCMCGDYFIEA